MIAHTHQPHGIVQDHWIPGWILSAILILVSVGVSILIGGIK